MLEKPDLQDQRIRTALQDEYGMQAAQITFLPLGVDLNAAVYRVVSADGKAYFLKLRSGLFDEMAVAVPQFLKSLGNPAIIAPLDTQKQQLWGNLDDYKMILYPFVDGLEGYEITPSDQDWFDIGAALKGVHTAKVPAALAQKIQRETYSPEGREIARNFQEQVERSAYADPIAAKLAGFMRLKRPEIAFMVERADLLGLALQARPLEFVLCHSDIHPGNFLIETNPAGVRGRVYIVDWDNPIFAPKERDLMSIGAGMSADLPDGREETLFYQGYGHVEMDPMALAYYRYERIIQDIAEFCKQIFLSDEGGEDREQAYQYFTGLFLPGQVVEVALKTDCTK